MAAAQPAGLAIPEAVALSTRRRWNASGVALLIIPALVFVAVFYVYPLVNLLDASLRDPNAAGVSLGQYVSVLNSRRVIATLERTLRLSVLSTVITLLLSYPIALYLIGAGRRIRTAILIVTFVSLAASLIVRNYGWLVVLSDAGPINQLLVALGIFAAPVRMVYSEGAVLVAIVHYAMPFMILPIYGSLVRLQPSTWEAAQVLGASPWATLWTVVIPQSMPGVYGGVTLCFAIATSAYVTPLMLGAPSTAFISQIAADELLIQLNFPRGSAIIVILTACTFAILAVYTLAVRRIGRAHV